MTTIYVPAHGDGCPTCNWARSISPTWVEAPAPADCGEAGCVELPGVASIPAPPVQAGLARPSGRHPSTTPAIEHHGTVRLPSPGPDGRRPAVTQPASASRPEL